MSIPIRNIYYLLMYAWDTLEEAATLDIDTESQASVLDLFTNVLIAGTEHLIRRGIDREYVSTSDTIAGVRGRIELAESIKRMCLPTARVHCRFDELSHDVPHNQILKATLRSLSRSELVEQKTRHEAHSTYRRLDDISDIRVSSAVFRRVRLHGNNKHYRLLMDICRLLAESLLVNEDTGESRFRDFTRDPTKMHSLFEKFVRNFYTKEQALYRVKSERLRWQAVPRSQNALDYLPTMLTDISLRNARSHLIFDTKFYPEAMDSRHGLDRIKTGHLYQLFSYLQNAAAGAEEPRLIGGALIYPTTTNSIDLRYTLHGHYVRVLSIDLNSPWPNIHDALLTLLESFTDEHLKQQPSV